MGGKQISDRFKRGAYSYHEFHAALSRIADQKSRTDVNDDHVYCLHGSDAISIGFMNIMRTVSTTVRKHEVQDRNGINMRCGEPTTSVIEPRDSRRRRRYVRGAAYRVLDSEHGKGWNRWEDGETTPPQPLMRSIASRVTIPPDQIARGRWDRKAW